MKIASNLEVDGNFNIGLTSTTISSAGNALFQTVSGTHFGNLSGTASNSVQLLNSQNFGMIGDVSAANISFNGTSSVTFNSVLSATGVVSGIYGNTTNVSQFQVDSKGRIISASNVAIQFPVASGGSVSSVGVSSTTLTIGSSPVTTSGNISVNLSLFGTSGTFPKISTDPFGRVISGTTLTSADIPVLPYISAIGILPWSQISGTPTTLSGYGVTSADLILSNYLPLTGGTLSGPGNLNVSGALSVGTSIFVNNYVKFLGTNTNIGFQAGLSITSGTSNTNIGNLAGNINSIGNFNTNIGVQAAQNNVSGSSNINIGINTGFANISGSNNTNIGTNAGALNTIGSNNTNIGFGAGRRQLGSNTIFIDSYGDRGSSSNELSAAPIVIANVNISPSAQNLSLNANTTVPQNFNVSGTTTLGTLTGILKGSSGVVSVATSADIPPLPYLPLSASITGGSGGSVSSVGVSSTTLIVGLSPVTTSGNISVNLSATGVSAGSYGSVNNIPIISLDSYGRIISATTISSVFYPASTYYSITTPQIISNTTTLTSIVPGIPSFSVLTQSPGNVIYIKGSGNISWSNLSNTITWTFVDGFNTFVSFGISGNDISNSVINTLYNWELDAKLEPQTSAGTSATVILVGTMKFYDSSTFTLVNLNESATVNTTIPNSLNISVQWSNATTNNKVTVNEITVSQASSNSGIIYTGVGVSSLGITSNTLIVSGSPVTTAGYIDVELSPIGFNGIIGANNWFPIFTVDAYGRVISATSAFDNDASSYLSLSGGTLSGTLYGPVISATSAMSLLSYTTDFNVVVPNGVFVGYPNTPIEVDGGVNSYFQIVSQNQSSGNTASTDYIANSDIGTNTNLYIDLGINGSQYSQSANSWYVNGPNDGYLYTQGSNLSIGAIGNSATSGNSIKFFVNSTSAQNIVMTLTSAGISGTNISAISLISNTISGTNISGTNISAISLISNTISGTNISGINIFSTSAMLNALPQIDSPITINLSNSGAFTHPIISLNSQLSAAVGNRFNFDFGLQEATNNAANFGFCYQGNGSSNNFITFGVFGTNDLLTISANKAATFLGPLYGSSGIGYNIGSGGQIVQATNKSTGVTLNKLTGNIIMNGAALASATSVAFTLTNSFIGANDFVDVQHTSAGSLGAYGFGITPAAGSASITVRNNTNASLSEAIAIKFMVFKAAIS